PAGPMTGGTKAAPQDQAQARPSARMITRTALRVAGSVAGLVALYYLLPLDHAATAAAVTILIIGLLAFIALVAVQVRSITRSPFPGAQAIEALAISVPLFLLLFASAYVVLAQISTTHFRGHPSRTPRLYFTVTVFSTARCGD